MLKAAKTVAARRADTLSVSDASHGPFSVEDYRNVLTEAKDYIRFINASDYSVVVSHIDLILSAQPIFLPSDPPPSQHMVVPDGYKLVPVNPTEDMMYAADKARSLPETYINEVWAAMVTASPAPETRERVDA